MNKILIAVIYLLSYRFNLQAQTQYDESLVPGYSLPPILRMQNGKAVNTIKQWELERRPELLGLFEEHVYGHSVQDKKKLRYKQTSINKKALGGLATRKEISIYLASDTNRKLNLLIYLPNSRKTPCPVFLGLNFAGNQAIHPDTEITITKNWTRFADEPGFVNGIAGKESRGRYYSRWPVEEIMKRGYAVATAYYGDLQPDRKDVAELEDNFHSWFYKDKDYKAPDNSWGAIGVWAWGLSRALDYLVEDKDIDGKRVAVIGHSRLGKSAIWAGAQDKRFAMVISNNSGEGGAAITRRKYGETIEIINKSFPHWFGEKFKDYNNNENALPVDFHELFALIAPRPLYVASASEDQWADPKGEYLSLYNSGEVYRLYGLEAFTKTELPAIETPVRSGVMGYHLRNGKHDITLYDWNNYMNFADKFLKKSY